MTFRASNQNRDCKSAMKFVDCDCEYCKSDSKVMTQNNYRRFLRYWSYNWILLKQKLISILML